MIIKKIQDSLQRSVSGLKTVQGSIIDPKFVDSLIFPYRAEIAYRNYKRDGWLNEAYYQRINLLPNTSLQVSAPSGSIVMIQPQYNNKFNPMPTFIKLGTSDGVSYCGTRDGQSFIRIKNRNQLSNLKADKITNPCNNPCLTYFLWAPASRWFEIYNNLNIQEAMINGCVADPLQVTEFNKDTDDFPMDEGDIVEMFELIKQDLISGKAYNPGIKMNEPSLEPEHPFKQTVAATTPQPQ